MNLPVLLLIATAALCAGFAGVYALSRKIDNYGFVDVAWSYAFAGLAAFYAVAATGWLPRRLLIGLMAGLWSVRLGTHLYHRVKGHHPVEDGRYQQLRRDWAVGFARRMFNFFQMQAVSVVILGLPFLLVAVNPAVGFHTLEIAGVALWFLALMGESLADGQLRAFKRDHANQGKVCEVGLWRYSRHPNYFFEWLIWVSFLVFALASPWGWLAVISPAVILYLLLRVTGIPLTEEQSVRSKGDAYRQYKQTTSAFFPWFRKVARSE